MRPIGGFVGLPWSFSEEAAAEKYRRVAALDPPIQSGPIQRRAGYRTLF
jgi:hypothetical protein